MKNLLLIFTLLFSTLMFSTPSYGEWTKVSEDVYGITHYVDFERIRKHDGYIYFWLLTDYLKPNKFGDLSVKNYQQSDCKLFRFKWLSVSFHTEPMGHGTVNNIEITGKYKDWIYPPPDSAQESILKIVCSQ